jgi:hypothetical protein
VHSPKLCPPPGRDAAPGFFVARLQAAAAPGVFWCDNKRLGGLSDLTPSEAADLAKVIDERLTKLENATER